MKAWLDRIQNWVLTQTPQHPVIVVRYEDLKQDTLKEVEKMVTFLGFPFNEEDTAQKLAEDFTSFKRPHNEEEDFKRYTDEQILHMKSVVLQAIKLTEDKNMTHVVRLSDYLQKFD